MSLKQIKSIVILILIVLFILFITDQLDFVASLSSLGIGYEKLESARVIMAVGAMVVVSLVYYRKRVVSFLELKKKAGREEESGEGVQFAKNELEINRLQGILGVILFSAIFIEIISKLFSTLDMRLMVPAVVALVFLGAVYIQKQASKDIHSFTSERIKVIRTILFVVFVFIFAISTVQKILSEGFSSKEFTILFIELGVFFAMILLTPKEYIRNFFKIPNLKK